MDLSPIFPIFAPQIIEYLIHLFEFLESAAKKIKRFVRRKVRKFRRVCCLVRQLKQAKCELQEALESEQQEKWQLKEELKIERATSTTLRDLLNAKLDR
jgi:ATP-dependent Lon protease